MLLLLLLLLLLFLFFVLTDLFLWIGSRSGHVPRAL